MVGIVTALLATIAKNALNTANLRKFCSVNSSVGTLIATFRCVTYRLRGTEYSALYNPGQE